MDVLEFTYDELPPSENKMRNVGYRYIGGKKKPVIVYTPEAERYKKRVLEHARTEFFVELTKFGKAHKTGDVYSIELVLVFERYDVLTKGWLSGKAKAPYKKVDAQNRHKLLLDAFSEALGIDDSLFFDVRIQKMVGEEDEEESIAIRIQRVDPAKFDVLPHFLERK